MVRRTVALFFAGFVALNALLFVTSEQVDRLRTARLAVYVAHCGRVYVWLVY